MYCSSCDHAIEDPEALYCSRCGERLHRENHCAACGKAHHPGARFCDRCGTPVDGTQQDQTSMFCQGSGRVILPGDRYFRCNDCHHVYLEAFHHGDEPLCRFCAEQRVDLSSPQETSAPDALVPAPPKGEADESLLLTAIGEADWALIHGGDFQMGSPPNERDRLDHERLHPVRVNSFELLKTPVTFTMYDLYCTAQDLNKPKDESWGRGRRPVINVNYWRILEYCAWLKRRTGWQLRLPTEAEWEYACRAGSTTPFWNGETITTDQANFNGNLAYAGGAKGEFRAMTTPVDSFPPNAWGLHDMHGNVWEWCASEYDAAYSGLEQLNAAIHPENSNPRALRGGSWYNPASAIRSASRNQLSPNLHFLKVGFRLVREIK